MDEPALHPDLEPIASLLGTWAGEGEGDWPSSGPFRYGEEMSFEQVGEPFLLYAQRSWTAGGEPLHFERGFVRPAGAGRVELVRRFELEGNVLRYELEMAMREVPLTRHLKGELKRAMPAEER